MPNQFGVYSAGGGVFTQSFDLQDPRYPRAQRVQFVREPIPELRLANSLYVPAGKWPARGWILLTRGDYDQLDPYGTFALQIDDFVNGSLTFQNLRIVQARCVTRGALADEDALYLVEITDQRGVLSNPWFKYPTNSQYNVRSPAYPEQYYTLSLNLGVPWTWDTMIGDLWNQANTFLGAYPGLPAGFAPTGTPENWIFPGVPLWEALTAIFDNLGLAVACDLTKVLPYTLAVPGQADAVFTGLQAQFAGNLEDDLEWIDAGAARAPGQVTVCFHTRYQYYGTEETVRRDALQWSSSAIYTVTLPGSAPYSSAPGKAIIWDDFTLRRDVDGNLLAADLAAAALIAADQVTQFYSRIERATAGYLRQEYAGTLPFYAGSLCDGVHWRQDFLRGDFGWRTELTRGFIWPEVQFKDILP